MLSQSNSFPSQLVKHQGHLEVLGSFTSSLLVTFQLPIEYKNRNGLFMKLLDEENYVFASPGELSQVALTYATSNVIK